MPASGTIVALLPGSRQSELEHMADLFVQTARMISEGAPQALFLVPLVARDALMLGLHHAHPQYGFDRRKGYPTAAHLAALRVHGVSIVHRRSFAPVRELLRRGEP